MSETKLGTDKRRRIRDQMRYTRDARQCRQLLVELECDRGKSVREMTKLLGVIRQSIYNWIAWVRERDEAADLRDARRTGRP